MKISDIAAWWGAAIATAVLIWDLYKWRRSGPHLEISVSLNMSTFGSAQRHGEGPFVVLEVRNNGNRKTTLTHCVGFCFANRLSKLLRRKPKHTFVVPDPVPGRIPYVLEAGERWMGMLEQSEDLVKWSLEDYLCLGVHHSGGKRAVTCHVVIHPTQA